MGGQVVEQIGPDEMKKGFSEKDGNRPSFFENCTLDGCHAKQRIPLLPVEYKVLIKPDDAEEVTRGGIIIPETVRDQRQYGIEKGTVVAIGGNAFSDPDWGDPKPKAGDRVFFVRHAGAEFRKDGEGQRQTYRIISDKDILGILMEES